jgi:hypothetical protein
MKRILDDYIKNTVNLMCYEYSIFYNSYSWHLICNRKGHHNPLEGNKMKKYFLAILGIMVALSFSSWAGAITTGSFSINDTMGSSQVYYGGTGQGEQTYGPYYDVIGGSNFEVDSLVATKDSNGKITVVLTGPYFSTGYAAGSWGVGQPGDLYISSTGWHMVSPDNHGKNDVFDPALEGWNYVVKFSRTNGPNNTFLYSFGGNYTQTGSENYWGGFRSQQAFQGGYSSQISAATSTLSGNTLTFIFDGTNLDPALIGYHWTMGCGNDVVEGGGTPVPEPGTLFLLGLGFVGLVVSRLRK